MKNTILAIANCLADALEETLGSSARFALVIWRDGEKLPTFSTSSEMRIDIARDMLQASANLISEAEAERHARNSPVGHA